MTPEATFSEAARTLAPWSVSKAKLVKTCPLAWKFKYVDHVTEHPGPKTRVGLGAHAVLESMERGASAETALEQAHRTLELTSEERAGLEPLLEGILRFIETLSRFRAKSAIDRELCEERLGLDENLEPTGFSASDVFFRGAWDLGFVLADGRVAIVDHKASRTKDLKWHAEQLRAYAIMALAHFPSLRKVWPAIHFVASGEIVWGRPTNADEIRSSLRAWFVSWINDAAERASKPDPQPVVSRFCEHCGYRPRCPAHTMEAAGERLVALSTRQALHG